MSVLTPPVNCWEERSCLQPRPRSRRALLFGDVPPDCGGGRRRAAGAVALGLALACLAVLKPLLWVSADGRGVPTPGSRLRPAAAAPLARRARLLVEHVGRPASSDLQLLAAAEQQAAGWQRQHQETSNGSGGSDSSGTQGGGNAGAQGGPGPQPQQPQLAHNLTVAPPAGALLRLYSQQLQSLLERSSALLRWVEPRARNRFCFPCTGRPGAQVSGQAAAPPADAPALLHTVGLAHSSGPKKSFARARPQVALVGNGPLSAEQRAAVARADCIVRFNRVNNLDG